MRRSDYTGKYGGTEQDLVAVEEPEVNCNDSAVSIVRGHAAELREVQEFLHGHNSWPRGLALIGEPGIGRSTLWSTAIQRAENLGIQVLSTKISSFEFKLNYSGLVDLLGGPAGDVIGELPDVQQTALNRVLVGGENPRIDERTTAAAFLTVLSRLADRAPVLLAIDDVQWLDPASRTVVSYATKRLKASMGVLTTVRSVGRSEPSLSALLPLPQEHSMVRIKLGPMTVAALRSAIAEHLGIRLARNVIERIHRISGGNIFCALELARSVDEGEGDGPPALPASLAEAVQERIGPTDGLRADMLLALACGAESTVTELASVTGSSVQEATEALEEVEERGVVAVRGHRIRFTHPMLAHGVYANASGPRRRAMHRRLARETGHPEDQARHLALGTASPDEATLHALDVAADLASTRGAPAAAAELLELGFSLGCNDPARRLRTAEQHCLAGALERAEQLLSGLVTELPEGESRAKAHLLIGTVHAHRHGAQALDALAVAVAEAREDPALRAPAHLALSSVLGLTGAAQQALTHAEHAFADADTARDPTLRSQALTLRVLTGVECGRGIDRNSLAAALTLESSGPETPAALRASNIEAVTDGWAGDLESACDRMALVAHRSKDRGNPMEVVWALGFVAHFNLWLGRPDAAGLAAEQAMEEAELVDGVVSRITALTCRAAVAAYRGATPDTERAAHAAIQAARHSGLRHLAIGPIASLAFEQTARRDYAATLTTLEPLLAAFDATHSTERAVAAHLPDAVEALVAVGRLADAESLVTALEDNGSRLQRPWMSAVGARGRAALFAADGDLKAAEMRADEAIDIHDLFPAPFERARTQLLLAQIQRRRRRSRRAFDTFAAAHDAFTQIGSPVWAERARLELHSSAGVPPSPQPSPTLTSTERRVAERAAGGLSNRDIAAELFISAKTVEMNLSRAYRKLGIRSRSQLYNKLNPGARD